MKILVMIAGIADPKWPLPSMVDGPALQEHSTRHTVLSPFDEGALELALKLRETNTGHTIHALVAGSESFARKIAEWRLDAVYRLEPKVAVAWDAARFARGIAEATQAVSDFPLVLVGREFGDFDDGAVPALMANTLDMPLFSLTTELSVREGELWATRQRVGSVERFRVPSRAVLTVTNDPHNRLRHPLLKNVMAARRLIVPAVPAGETAATVTLNQISVPQASQRTSACRMLTGSIVQQCDALAQVLLQQGVVV